jgi:hypothetical protein
MGPTALLPLRRKLCYGFLSPLKIHCHRPGSNPRTLGPVGNHQNPRRRRLLENPFRQIKTMYLDSFRVVWQPLVYSNREDLNPCCDFGSYKITARYVFQKTAPSWRGHLWITHLGSHLSCAVPPHKVHWRTEEEKREALLHLVITNVTFRASDTRRALLHLHKAATACDLIIGQRVCHATVQLHTWCCWKLSESYLVLKYYNLITQISSTRGGTVFILSRRHGMCKKRYNL